MAIYITGDTHGDIDFHKLNSASFPQGRLLTKNDYVIICGDFGAIWDGSNSDKYLLDWYSNKPWTTLFVDGNHENFDLLNSYPVTEWHGGKVHQITPSVIHLMRGQFYTIDNKTFFTMGGATSTDKAWRKEHISWWPQEVFSDEDIKEALHNLTAHDYEVDYIITHAAPTKVIFDVFPHYKPDIVTNTLNSIYKSITFRHWYCGHYHINMDYNDLSFLYTNIIRLDSEE